MNRTISFFIGILLGAILGAVITQTVCIKPNKEYVYVDIDRIISTIAQNIGNSNVSQDALPAKVNDLKHTFERALIVYQQAHNAIILSSKPIKGAIDKTDYFIGQLGLLPAQSPDVAAGSVSQLASGSQASASHVTDIEPRSISEDSKTVHKTPVSDTQVSEPAVSETPVSETLVLETLVPETRISEAHEANSESISNLAPSKPVSVSTDSSGDNGVDSTIQKPLTPENQSISAPGTTVTDEQTAGDSASENLIPKPTTQPEVSKTISEPFKNLNQAEDNSQLVTQQTTSE